MAIDETIREEAVAWAVRTGDPAFDDWDGFTRWLEADPAHAAIYDEVVLAVDDAAQVLPAIPEPQNDDEPVQSAPRRTWLGGGIAAALAIVGIWQTQSDRVIETAPGEMHVIALADGNEIVLAGGSRIVLDRSHPQNASLEHGQALFRLNHDAAAPFTLTVGEDRLVDIGTVFDVKHTDAGMSVAVSEGAVIFNPGVQDARVDPGEMLVSLAGSGTYTIAAVAPEQVGEWREGRLTFVDAPLEEVAADLSRATGLDFTARAAGDHRVSGSLLVDPVRDDPGSVGALLGVDVRRAGDVWEMEAQ